jgi:hypothetical protein
MAGGDELPQLLGHRAGLFLRDVVSLPAMIPPHTSLRTGCSGIQRRYAELACWPDPVTALP